MNNKAAENRIITLYHGSISQFNEVDVNEGEPYKDFGRGFYTTRVYSHAKKLALRNKRIAEKDFKRNFNAYIYTFEFDLNKLKNFKVKEFKEADLEWINFILANRKSKNRTHDYDVVIGPTADDDTLAVINAYFLKLYGEIGSERALSRLIEETEHEKLPEQIFFATNEAAKLLIMKGGKLI